MKYLLFITIIALASCQTAQTTIIDGKVNKIETAGCKVLSGRDRINCEKQLRSLCSQAKNATAKNRFISEIRSGKIVVRTNELCLIGDRGYKFSCFRYQQTRSDPTMWQRVQDYSVAYLGGLLTGLALAFL